MKIGKLCAKDNRRGDDRRADSAPELEGLLSRHAAFDRFEQMMFKLVDRRRLLRRAEDLRQAIARLGS
jgi:hypothetical protein